MQIAPYEATIDPGPLLDAIRIKPIEDGVLEFYGAPVSTMMSMVFECDVEPKKIQRAWIELLVDDTDEPGEAAILLNGTTTIKIQGAVLGEGPGHRGRLIVPVEAMVLTRNTLDFRFADNLEGRTRGFTINESMLLLELK